MVALQAGFTAKIGWPAGTDPFRSSGVTSQRQPQQYNRKYTHHLFEEEFRQIGRRVNIGAL